MSSDTAGTGRLDTGQTPQSEQLERLHPDVVNVWRIKQGLAAGLILLGALVYDVTNIFDETRALPLFLLSGAAFVLGIAFLVYIPRLRYRFWRYALRTDELVLRYGVINRVMTIVPLMRIQHLDVSQDVVEREFDLGKLIVHTAGTRSSTVVVPGLELDLAERLRDDMRDLIIDEAL